MVSGSGYVCLACAMFWVIGEEIPCVGLLLVRDPLSDPKFIFPEDPLGWL